MNRFLNDELKVQGDNTGRETDKLLEQIEELQEPTKLEDNTLLEALAEKRIEHLAEKGRRESIVNR